MAIGTPDGRVLHRDQTQRDSNVSSARVRSILHFLPLVSYTSLWQQAIRGRSALQCHLLASCCRGSTVPLTSMFFLLIHETHRSFVVASSRRLHDSAKQHGSAHVHSGIVFTMWQQRCNSALQYSSAHFHTRHRLHDRLINTMLQQLGSTALHCLVLK